MYVFWFAAALLTLGACLAILAPLARREVDRPSASDYDLEVYKDQLAELERDAARGLIQPSEADEARTEIGRRILKVAAGAQPAAEQKTQVSARFVAIAAVLIVPLVSWGLYSYLGSPDLPSQPLQARLAANPEKSQVQELVGRTEAYLASNPDDGKGWDVLAPVYMRMGRYQDAVTAFGNAIRLEGSTVDRETGLGWAIAASQGGALVPEARAAFERALNLEPGSPMPRFFLAAAMSQDGRFEEATAAWRALLADLPADSPWRLDVEQALADVAKHVAGTSEPSTSQPPANEPSALPAPSEEEVDAAASMSDADRTAMIESMVANLDEKLKQNPKDVDGWHRLLRSYMVLDRRDEATAALERGVAALGEGSAEAKALVEFASGLGLTRTE